MDLGVAERTGSLQSNLVGWAEILESGFPSFAACGARLSRVKSPQRRAGLLYERKVIDLLRKEYGASVESHVWLRYQLAEGGALSPAKICQPDGWLYLRGKIVLFEIKTRHNPQAWTQLRTIYQPVLRMIFPEVEIRVCEVTKWFDPQVAWPEECHIVDSLEEMCSMPDVFGVWVCRP